MNIIVMDSKYWPAIEKLGIKKQEIAAVVEGAAKEVEQLISFLPSHVNLSVYPSEEGSAIPETGVSGMTYGDEHCNVFFDSTIPYGKEELLARLRSTIFHELVHTTTFQYESWRPTALFGATTEGLATVFERDYAGSKVLWGEYEDDNTMHEWLRELKSLPGSDQKSMDYFVDHPDGRKWIVYKTGTWMIDKLVASGADLQDLMKLSHQDIIERFDGLSARGLHD